MIEFFKEPNIHWMAKAKYFYGLSAILLLAGWFSIWQKGGLYYGIDFKGGTNVDVKFAKAPVVDDLRKSLSTQGLGGAEIQAISDSALAGQASSEVLIFIEQRNAEDQDLDASKARVIAALGAAYGITETNKPDFNVVPLVSLAATLNQKDPLNLGAAAGDRYNQLAKKILDYRDKVANGLVGNLSDLSPVDGVTPAVITVLKDSFSVGPFTIRNTEIVGPKVGAELRNQAMWVTLLALGGMLLYIAFRFEWVFGAAAVLAVFHDVLITLGFFSLLHYEISLTVIAALLTLVGYSMNDTIVIFDRIRENRRLLRKEEF
ncbi:MAG TPA: hypothetical protein VEU98_00445, partial [Candidatus Eremiobacteraceae bacterium]|nr:hypothetical protein [Candidatus Eremiobacteraceae bacterium]